MRRSRSFLACRPCRRERTSLFSKEIATSRSRSSSYPWPYRTSLHSSSPTISVGSSRAVRVTSPASKCVRAVVRCPDRQSSPYPRCHIFCSVRSAGSRSRFFAALGPLVHVPACRSLPSVTRDRAHSEHELEPDHNPDDPGRRKLCRCARRRQSQAAAGRSSGDDYAIVRSWEAAHC